MRTLKERGVDEVRALRQRALRIRAMGRISEEDCRYITRRCDEIEERIIGMREEDPGRREF